MEFRLFPGLLKETDVLVTVSLLVFLASVGVKLRLTKLAKVTVDIDF
jgi:hypothetical protein